MPKIWAMRWTVLYLENREMDIAHLLSCSYALVVELKGNIWVHVSEMIRSWIFASSMAGCSQIQLSHLYFGIPDQLACCEGHGSYHRPQMGTSPIRRSNPNGTGLLLLMAVQNIARRFWKAHLRSCAKSPTCLNSLSRPRSNVCFLERIRKALVLPESGKGDTVATHKISVAD